jgi:Zn-finger nucleic acid-binding protein
MVTLEYCRIEIDHCISCGGIWLDSGELDLLLRDGVGRVSVAPIPVIRGKGERRRRCPRCFKKMGGARVGGEGLITVERCNGGHGLWFEREELESVLAAAGGIDNRIKELLDGIFGQETLRKEGEPEQC